MLQQGQVVKANIVMRCLATIERAGNALPNPVLLFLYLSIAVVLLSGIAAFFELSVDDPRPLGSPGREPSGSISVISLCTLAGVHRILTSLVSNFIQFAPLGTVLVALLGVGIAERSGLISALMRKIVIGAPAKLVTLCIVFAGVISNTAGELGYVVLIPLAAVIFHSLGRHPLAGLAAAFAGVSGGYSANLLLGAVDPVLSGITQQAAQLVAQNYQVGAEANWYFMLASTFLVTLSAYAVTEYIVEPSLGRYQIQEASAKQQQAITAELSDAALSDLENKALKRAAIVAVLFFIVLALTVLPEHGILLNPATGKLAGSPFLQSIVAFIFLFFTLTGMTYGFSVGSFKRQDDIVDAMSASLATLSAFLVLVFFAAQFVAYFKWTNLGIIFAVLGAEGLQGLNLSGPWLFILFIMICAVINLLLGSASAQWAITAPIFVPMLMLLGYAPELIQAAYRIGDSSTNIITPMMSYFGLIIAVADKYRHNIGIGTMIAMMLPYSVAFLCLWTLFFIVWVFLFQIPVGPGAALFFSH